MKIRYLKSTFTLFFKARYNLTVSVHKKSELYLSVTSVEDNGTFTCVASNRAGSATANFTLHVVIPMPPKPPQASTQILSQK